MSEPRAGLSKSKSIRLTLGLVLGGLLLYLALKDVHLQEVKGALAEANWLFVLAALGVFIAGTLLKAWRWLVLLGPVGKQRLHSGRAAYAILLKSHVIGQMLNMLFPARVGELSRIFIVGKRGPGYIFIAGTIVVEKALDLAAYALLFLLLLFLLPLPNWLSGSGYAFMGVGAVMAIALWLMAFQREWVLAHLERVQSRLPMRFQGSWLSHLRQGLSSLDSLQGRSNLWKLALSSTLIWVGALGVNYLLLLAFQIELPLTAALLVLVALQAGVTITAVPGNIGVFEYICVLSLGLYQVGQAKALSYGILLHATVLLPIVIFGLLFYWLLEVRGEWAGSVRS